MAPRVANSPALVLDLVPTNDFLRMSKYNRAANNRYEPSVTGYLMRLSPSTAQPMLFELQEKLSRSPGVSSQQRGAELNQVMRLVWRRRYFVLRSDNCLYWYKSPTVSSKLDQANNISVIYYPNVSDLCHNDPIHVINVYRMLNHSEASTCKALARL